MKRIISLSFALLAVYSAITPAVTRPAPADYVENQIIVKFRRPVTDTLEIKLAEGISTSELKLSRSLNSLNKIYRFKKARPLFKNFKKNRQSVKTLLRKDKALLNKREKRILRRLNRAPRGAKVPELDRIYKIDLDLEEDQSLEDVVAAYNDDPDVEYAELNYIVSICKTPNDPLYPLQWPLNNTGQMYPESGYYNPPPGTPDCDIDAPEAWDIHTGNPEIVIAVVDTGVDYSHRDIDDNMWVNAGEIPGNGLDDDDNGYIDDIYGYDFRNDDSDPIDDHGHGTHCAGTIAAEGNNALDIVGICWDAKIIALKFLNSSGRGSTTDAIEAFYYAVANGADITSNSWGGGFYSETMEDAINYAHNQGVIMVAAAGNDNSTYPFYPAYYDHMISVAATNSNDARATFSNYGNWVDIAAPGVDVLSLRATGTSAGTIYDDYTTVASGTSMACPHMAGAYALLLSAYPFKTNDELYDILMETVDPIAPEICLSGGRLNLFNAMHMAVSSQGYIILDQDGYSCSGVVSVLLADRDIEGQGSQEVIITTSGGDLETVVLSETDILGIFKGTISTDSGAANTEDSILQLSHGQIITATYEDANDGTGNPATASDTAAADCEYPVIFNVDIAPAGPEPTVTFETDEPTTARVLCSLSCGGPNVIVKSDTKLTISHSIKLLGVSPVTEYYFIIEIADAAGNKTVDDNGGDCYSFTTTSDELYVPGDYLTIQEAIDYAWYDRGTIWVADGVYTGQGNHNIDFKGKSITVRSENGPENCVIDCQNLERGFYFHSREGERSILDGFTITNGYAHGDNYNRHGGGAIRCDDSSPVISNCIMNNNSAAWDGGGINNYNSDPTIINCVFIENSAINNDGGGINNYYSSPIITNCMFINNSAYDWGGGIRNVYSSNPAITNCLFSRNVSDEGGGIFNYYNSNPTILNCTFCGNSAPTGGSVIDSEEDSHVTVINSIVWGNVGPEISGGGYNVSYSNIEGGWPGIGNLNTNPFFTDPNNEDFHLLPGSPCIDTGDPNYIAGPNETDLGGLPRVFGGRVDMGAYEFTSIQARLWLFPQIINRHSRMKRIMAWIHFPRDITKDQIDKDQPVLLYYPDAAEPIESIRQYVFQHGRGRYKRTYVLAYYDKAELMAAVPDNGTVDLQVVGSLKSGQYFYGSDTVRIIGPRWRRWWRWRRHR